MKKGLLLGKFIPFHEGHIALINFALEHTCSLDVLVCANKNESIDGFTRYNWIKDYYSGCNTVHVHLVEYDDTILPASSVPSREAAFKWVDYLKDRFPGIELFISSEPYGEYVAEYWNIKHLYFDEHRRRVPVSGTQILAAPFEYWRFIPAIVRPFFVKKICIVGSESTGKSVLTEKLAAYYNTVFVPEIARDIVDTSATCTLSDLNTIATVHAKAIIEKIPLAEKLLFVDTDVIITKSYAAFLFNKTLDIEDWVNEANRFDLYLFLETDSPFVQDGTRLDEQARKRLDVFHKKEFNKQGITYHTISGTWEERFNTALNIVNERFF